MLKTALFNQKGEDVSLKFFEDTLNDWLQRGVPAKGNKNSSVNIQFFCSHFVLFCYLWAAAELQPGNTKLPGLDYVLGTKVKVSPTELYTRIKSSGDGFFRYKGRLQG